MQQLSVSSLVRYLKNRIDHDSNLQKVYVSGEISNYHRHFSGHLYFTLKDEKASISCVMFKSAAASLYAEPKTGDHVLIYGNVSVFEASGQVQLYVLRMEPDGLGSLYIQYEALKQKLAQEGKFEDTHKIPISTIYPQKVAILVGDRSAAMSDIRTAFARRWPLCQTDYYPVLVQGEEAAADIIEKLLIIDPMNYDAIILARGGGSFEDLFCFNDERLVNVIYDLQTFIVTGIGHEQDYTLADYVADMRAATPTAAVELITPDIEDVRDEISAMEEEMYAALLNGMNMKQQNYDRLTDRLFHYRTRFTRLSLKIDHKIEKIRQILRYVISDRCKMIERFEEDFAFKLDLRLNDAKMTLKRLNTLMEAYSCENVLKRGYTLVLQDDKVIRKKSELEKKGFKIRFSDGVIEAIERENHGE